MLLLWHEALGSDDEQAAEDELCARVLYAQEDGGHGEPGMLLQRLHLVQGLLAFVRMLRRGRPGEPKTPEWASVTLSRRRFFVLEVEPQIFMALGVHPTVEIKDHGPGYEALLREMHGMFMLFHGTIVSNLRSLPPVSARSDTLENLENYLDGQQRFQSLAELIATRYNATFAPEKNVPNIHPLPPFLYINRVNLAFRMQQVPRLLKSKEDDLFPVPVKLLAHYFPASTMALVNELHAELHRCSSAGNREICVRTRHAGWVLAKKSETSHREMYVFFDSKVSSVYELSDSLQMLLHDQFGNVLF
ncbi:uncharacterized protein IUM83_02607 [Phytophthora cinnamomi]|uniref:uncharacterized protein n=1 Tax=Phytophthora cinnamomi TaxID=4785 RepID=UPI00355AAE72|nr:hypothetical protein IUM83_02607 [Phytophthora cinnamomi]